MKMKYVFASYVEAKFDENKKLTIGIYTIAENEEQCVQMVKNECKSDEEIKSFEILRTERLGASIFIERGIKDDE